MKISILFLFIAASISSATFTVPPTLSDVNGNKVISFTVSNPIDVEIAIVDANSQIVRHLAAGVLGGDTNPPSPLKPGLSQSIEWDGLDDKGLTLNPAGLNVRVRLGVYPKFDRSISTRQFPAKWTQVLYGPGSVSSTDDLLSMEHPVWRTLPGADVHGMTDTFPDGTNKIKFYSGLTGLDMSISDKTDEIILKSKAGSYIPVIKIDGLTGLLKSAFPDSFYKGYYFPKPTPYPTYTVWGHDGEPTVDWEGRYIYADENGGGSGMWSNNFIYRFNMDGTPAPFASSGQNVILQNKFAGGDHRGRGITAGPDGSIYHAHYFDITDSSDKYTYGLNAAQLINIYHVAKYDSNGLLVNPSIVKSFGNIGQGIRIDPKGNIFMGVRVKPYGQPMPNNVYSKVTRDSLNKYSQFYWMDETYGSIVKFPPEGGSIVPDLSNGNLMGGRYNDRAKANNMLWMHYGASFQATHSSFRSDCFCYTPRFDVDRFGRVIFPNPFENEFKALDNNGNMIFRIHNRDLFNNVKIGLGHNIQVTDKGIYIADWMNNQIVRFNWTSDDSVLLPITGTLTEKTNGNSCDEIFNDPNPFNPITTIHFSGLSNDGTLSIYNASGKKVSTLNLTKNSTTGKQSVVWDATNQASGVYVALVKSSNRTIKKSIILVR